MKCSQVKKRLSAFQDGEVKPGEHQEIANHLKTCSMCREQYAELERVWQALGDFEEIVPSPNFYADLVKKINMPEALPSPSGFQWILQAFSPSWAAAALLIAAILMGTFLGNILAKGVFTWQDQARYSQSAVEAFSWKAFDAIPPGTLADNYIRLASNQGEERR